MCLGLTGRKVFLFVSLACASCSLAINSCLVFKSRNLQVQSVGEGVRKDRLERVDGTTAVAILQLRPEITDDGGAIDVTMRIRRKITSSVARKERDSSIEVLQQAISDLKEQRRKAETRGLDTKLLQEQLSSAQRLLRIEKEHLPSSYSVIMVTIYSGEDQPAHRQYSSLPLWRDAWMIPPGQRDGPFAYKHRIKTNLGPGHYTIIMTPIDVVNDGVQGGSDTLTFTMKR